jgi:CRISPR-associated protein Csa1
MLSGLAYHEVVRSTIFEIKRLLYQEITDGSKLIERLFPKLEIPLEICKKLNVKDAEENCLKLYRYLVIQIAASIDRVISKFPFADAENIVGKALPPFVEKRVDGSLLGLSENLSVDVFTPYNVIADLKSGEERDRNLLLLAGYALALEADEFTDVNFGFVVYLRFNRSVQFKLRHSLISDELRRQFLELRDEAIDLIESGIDPGKPESCSKYCCFYGVCNEDGG